MSTPSERERNPRTTWFFAAAGGVALLLAAVFLFRSTQAAGIGLFAGIALVAAAELLVSTKSRIAANPLVAAGIGILYATLYSMNARWHLVPLALAFTGMLIVTAAAVFLARRRDSQFVALLGVVGGFINAYLLSTSENYPLAVFAYLIALQIAVAWLLIEKRWWALLTPTVVLTAVYEWGWVLSGLNVSLLSVTVAIFLVSAVVGTIPLWHDTGRDCPTGYRWLAIAAAHSPLLFAIQVAGHANYAKQYCLLFAFLLVINAGLQLIASRGNDSDDSRGHNGAPMGVRLRWLHEEGGIATLIVFIVWFRSSFIGESWPLLLAWAVLFITLYLVRVSSFVGLMFGIFAGLGIYAPEHWRAIALTMFVMLGVVIYVAVKRGKPTVAAVAIAVSSIALMTMHPPLWTLVALHALLFAELFFVAWVSELHVLAILSVPFLVAMAITVYSPAAWSRYSVVTLPAIVAAPSLLFIAYPLTLGGRRRASLTPYVAAALAGLVVLIIGGTAHVAGWVALVETLLTALLLWRATRLDPPQADSDFERASRRVTFLIALTLTFSCISAFALLPAAGSVSLFALGLVGLVWLFVRLRRRLFLGWATGLTAWVFFSLAFDGQLITATGTWRSLPIYIPVYLVCGVAMFAAAYLIRLDRPLLQRVFSVACLFELWFLINLFIANRFSSSNGAAVFDFSASQPGENAVYTVAWAVIATGLLVLGYLIRWPAGRGAALCLLVTAVLKGFLVDLPLLEAPYLTVSLAGLGLSVAVVAMVLQWRWVGISLGLDRPITR